MQYSSKEVQFGEEKPLSRQCQCIYLVIYNQKTMSCAMHNSFVTMVVFLAEKGVSSSREGLWRSEAATWRWRDKGHREGTVCSLLGWLQFKFQLYPRILFSGGISSKCSLGCILFWWWTSADCVFYHILSLGFLHHDIYTHQLESLFI